MKLSVTIITLNEEKNIANCIKSAGFADEIIVVDSNSSDRTQEVAESLGAKVHVHPFQGYGQQKNFAASLAKGQWVFNIDADEEISPELRKSIEAILQNPHSKSAYKVPRLTNFCGRWIFYGGWYPGYITRLCKNGEAKWTEPHVHEDLQLLNGKEYGYLEGNLLHYSFPTIKSQIQTNIKYSDLASKDLVERKGRYPYLFELLVRPFFKFIECYIIKKGFLDRAPGFIIAVNAAHSMFIKYSTAYLRTKKIRFGDKEVAWRKD